MHGMLALSERNIFNTHVTASMITEKRLNYKNVNGNIFIGRFSGSEAPIISALQGKSPS